MRKGAYRTVTTVSLWRKMAGKALALSLVAFVLVGSLGLITSAAAPDPAAMAILHQADAARAAVATAMVSRSGRAPARVTEARAAVPKASPAGAPIVLAPAPLKSSQALEPQPGETAKASAEAKTDVKNGGPGGDTPAAEEFSVIDAGISAPPPHVPDNYLAGSTLSSAQGMVSEKEPNDTSATATPLGGTNVVATGSIYKLSNGPSTANGDVDVWSFGGTAGDRVYAATMTSFGAAGSSDSTLELLGTDGTTIIETDLDDGSLSSTASSIAGATLPATGTFYLRVKQATGGSRIQPYYLHFRLQSGSPTAEVEGNDTPATANPLPANGWVSGARNPAVATEQDWFSFSANAGDTVYLSLDLDPERDNVQWNGRLGIALFGDAGNQILVVDDASTGSATNPLSEALFMTVKTTGTYYAFVDSATAATGGATATYNLSVSVHPATPIGTNCMVYTSSNVPLTIGPGAVTTNSTITVPGNPRIEDLNVSISLNHILMTDVDAALISPAGNENSLFTDLGASTQTQLDLDIDDEAGIPPVFTVLKGEGFQPELSYRLNWFKGESGGGTWTLRLRDDTSNTSGGNLTAWSITICEPPAPAVCAGTTVTVLSKDFEANNGGFTPSAGTTAPWQWGTPTVAPINTCNSGVNCWKTNLTGLYNANANQDLVSPTMNLSGLGAPITLTWAQKYQLESSSFDTFWLDAREVGPANATNLFQFLDATMTDSVGSPAITLQETAGWGLVTRDISAYANKPAVQLRWGFVSDTSGQFAGLAIDDVTVTACCTPASCNDNNPCTDDVCDAVLGCTHVGNSASCSDGNPCTTGDTCSGGSCVPGPNPCNDNNACTLDICDGVGGCTYQAVDCDDNNVCTDDSCDPGTGCGHASNTAPCTDGNPCTIGDVCGGGTCVPGAAALPAPVQFCSGGSITINDVTAPTTATPYPSGIVITGQPSYLCSVTLGVNGLTHTFPDDIDMLLARLSGTNAIVMSDAGGSVALTGVNFTLSDNGATPLPDATAIVTGTTYQPANYAGTGTEVWPAPAPVPSGGSALSTFTGSNPNGTWNLWVVDDQGGDSGSMSGWCLNIVSVCTIDTDCNDGNACTDDACVNSTCTHTNNTVSCNDGNACTTGDTCSGGTCIGGNGPNCDDGDVCTTDTCNPATGLCEHPPVVCNDNNSCTDDACQSPTTGCVYTANDANTCSDNNACSQSDACVNGTCVGSNPVNCDDGNACTTDACDPASGSCGHVNNTNTCDDGNPCTSGDTCGPNPVAVLGENWDLAAPPALSPGWTSAVIAGTGNVWTTVGTSSDSPPNSAFGFDGAVVADEVLVSPPIVIGSSVATVSFRNRWSFESATSCFDAGVLEIKIGAGPFTDIVTAGGSFVTGGYTGTVSAAFSNPLANRSAWCNASAGYPSYLTTNVNLPASASGQTIQLRWRIGSDTSTGGSGQNIDTIVVTDSVNQCNQSTPTDCNDNNPCTDDTCDPAIGCVHTNNTNPCDDGSACTVNDTCGGGFCAGAGIICDDGNVCTTDSCDPASGCFATNNTAPCNDGNPCTSGDTCGGGTCHAGTPVVCNDGNVCTDDSCDPASGCVATPNTAPCEDGSACTVNDTCGGGTCHAGSPRVCNDGNVCTDDSCDPATGCVYTNNTAPCSDGNACTQDVCRDGACGCPVVSGACQGSVASYDSTDVPKVIPTTISTVTSTLTVAGAGPYLSDVNVQTFITHSFVGDMQITLKSPAGTIVTLDSNNGSSVDNVFNGTVWDDDADPGNQVPYATPLAASNLVTDTTFTNLVVKPTLVPEEPLGAFIGENPNGVWTLTIADQATGDGGNLANWSLALTTLSAPPATATVSYPSTDVPKTIPTTAPPNVVVSTVAVAGAGTQIGQVRLKDFILHTFNGDLDITIKSPAGTIVTLTTDNGAGNDNVFNGTQWDDKADPGNQVPYVVPLAASLMATDTAYTNLVVKPTLTPEEALAAFIGEDPNGVWTLTISDDANLDGGTLTSWTLEVTTTTCQVSQCAVTCNDNNPCTDDSCDPATGCVYTNNTASCNDGFACTTNDTCSGGSCAGTPVVCNDGNVCTDDACNPATGQCVYANNTNACNDGNACTTNDACAGPSVCGATENFDGVTAPALPSGWASTTTGSGSVWSTQNTSSDTAPNSAFAIDGAGPLAADEVLDSAPIAISSATASLTFRNRWSFESATSCFDAGVLEIKIGAGPFTDIVTAGGSFVSGGYTGTVSASFSNPLAGRSAWCNISTGYPAYVTTVVNLPAAAAGQTIQLRFRVGSDVSVAGIGQNIDTIAVGDSCPAVCTGGAALDCNDNNPCTDDSCDPTTGCVHTNNTSPCGDPSDTDCDNPDSCFNGACAANNEPPGTSCSDGNACTQDVCLSGGACGCPVVSGACQGSVASYDSTDVPKVIPTTISTVTSTLTVAGAGPYLSDVNVQTFITHSFVGDMQITLKSPAGTIVTLDSNNGSSVDNVFNGTVWDDDADPGNQVPYATPLAASNLVTDTTFTNLVVKPTLVPEEPLGAFIGENPNGVWTLTIADQATGDGGNLANWSLALTTLSAPPATATVSYPSTDVPKTIPTTAPPNVVVSTVAVAGAGTQIGQVRLKDFILHTFNGDLDITIKSPAGTIVTLTTDNGAGNDNVFNGTQWDDKADPGNQVPYVVPLAASLMATDTAYTNLVVKPTLTPEEALAAFIGEDPNGVWTLTISDDANLDGGTLTSWTLEVTTTTCQVSQCAVTCNDNNPCTDDSCDPATGCVYTNNTASCNDGFACTTNDTCSGGSCAGTPVVCNDGNVCTDDACNPATGQCVYANNTNACNDGNACTTNDACAGPSVCGATENFDGVTAPALPSGWASTTTGSGSVWSTQNTSSDTAPNSAFAIDGAGPLAADEVLDSAPIAISSATASLTFRNRWSFESATSCFDAGVLEIKIGAGPFTDIVTAGGSFVSGGYTGTVSASFSNPLAGRSAWCNISTGYPAYVTTVVNLPAAAAGQTIQLRFRVGSDVSVAGIGQNIDTIAVGDSCPAVCTGGAALDCNDNNPCTDDSCDPATGCVHTNNTSPCDDGTACTTNDTCGNGTCNGGEPPICDDHNPCTTDTCTPATGCVYTNNVNPCDDGNACTTNDTCGGGTCNGGAPPVCNDGNVCTTDSCDPGTGCVYTNNVNPCNDGNACTTNDTCGGGTCNGGAPPVCNDGNVCTTDTCDPATGCVYTNNNDPCNDGNACTTNDTCGAGTCNGGAPLVCNDGNVCTTDTCAAATGCVYTNNTSPCSDGNACTTGDTCGGGVCNPGGPTNCDDSQCCTVDSCDPATGCVHTANTTPPVFVAQPSLGTCPVLWPPNHTYADFTVANTGATATAACGIASVQFASCNSSQPENGTSVGDGNTVRDCVYEPGALHLRAERDGTCSPLGRVYSTHLVATDVCGNTATSAPLEVSVWHDRGHQPTGTIYAGGGTPIDTRSGATGTYGPGCGAGGTCANGTTADNSDENPEMEVSQTASISVDDLHVEKASGGNLKLTWTEPAHQAAINVTRFHVYRLDPVTMDWTLIAEVSKQTTSYQDPVLNDGISHQYKITAMIK